MTYIFYFKNITNKIFSYKQKIYYKKNSQKIFYI